MVKLPTRKLNKKNRGPAAASRLGVSKPRPKKNLKKGIKKDTPSGSVPKPTKTADSKTKPKKNFKNSIKKDNSSGSAPKPTKTTDSKTQPTLKAKKNLKNGIKKDNSSSSVPKLTKTTDSKTQPTLRAKKNLKNGIKKNNPSGSVPKPTKTTDSKTQLTQVKKKENEGHPQSKIRNQKKTKGGKAKQNIAKKPKLSVKCIGRAAKKDQKLMKRFANNVKEAPKNKVTKVDPAQLISLELVQAAVSGLRKLPSFGKTERKSLHDITDVDERFVYLQVTLCKLPNVTDDFHLTRPATVSVYLPNSLVTDNTDVILITKDLQRGIKKDHQNSLNYFKELLRIKEATSLINEIIPLRQLKVEYREFEAKRFLANRTDMLLCDDTVMRFIPKFLTKHFFTKKKLPVQVNLKAKDLQKEILRALSVSKIFFSMRGNSHLMKIGRMSQTDDEIQQNVLAAVQKLASHAPGKWGNIQSLNLKLEGTISIPLYVKIDSLNKVKAVAAQPLFPGSPVSGTLTTQPGRCITVFPDGSVTVTSLAKNRSRLAEENETKNEIKKPESKDVKKGKRGKKSAKSKSKVEFPETETEVSTTKEEAKKKKNTKRKMTEKTTNKAKKQKKVEGSDSDSEEDDLEEQEMTYLRQLNQEESTGGQEEDEDSEEDVWADSDSDMEDGD